MEISLQQLKENPELKSVFNESEDLEKAVRIPYVIKNKILMSPGIWNGYYYKDATITHAFDNSDWDSKEVVSLFLDHEDERSSEWVGWVKNQKIDGEDIRGDLVIVDKATAIKLYAGAKFGISPKVRGQEEDGEMKNFVFDNFSVVYNPAVKTAYINNSQKIKESELTGFEEIRKEKGMSVGEFYAIPRKPSSDSKLPIYDAAHVRNALARFNQIKGASSSEISTAKGKIQSAAKKFGVEISDKFMEEIKMTEEDKPKEEVKEEPKEEVKTEEEPKKEEAEEPKAEVKEEPKEEVKAEEKPAESEMSELMGKLTELLNKFQKKEDEVPAAGTPEEEVPKADKKEDVEDEKKKKMSDAEMLEVTSNPGWIGFVKEMKEKDSKMDLNEIATAFKDSQKSDKMSEKVTELSEKIAKFEAKLQEPAKLSMHAGSKILKETDADSGFLAALKEGRM